MTTGGEGKRPLEDGETPEAKRKALSLVDLFAEAQAADRLYCAAPETLISAILGSTEEDSDSDSESVSEQQDTLRLLAIQGYESTLEAIQSSQDLTSESRWIKASSLLRLGSLVSLAEYLQKAIQEMEHLELEDPDFVTRQGSEFFLTLGRAWVELFCQQVSTDQQTCKLDKLSASEKHPLEHIYESYEKAFSLLTETQRNPELCLSRVNDILQVVELDQTSNEEEEDRKCSSIVTSKALEWALNLLVRDVPKSTYFDPLLCGRLMFRLGSTTKSLDWIDKAIQELERGLQNSEQADGDSKESLVDLIYTLVQALMTRSILVTDEDSCVEAFEKAFSLAQRGLSMDPDHEGLQDVVGVADGEDSISMR